MSAVTSISLISKSSVIVLLKQRLPKDLILLLPFYGIAGSLQRSMMLWFDHLPLDHLTSTENTLTFSHSPYCMACTMATWSSCERCLTDTKAPLCSNSRSIAGYLCCSIALQCEEQFTWMRSGSCKYHFISVPHCPFPLTPPLQAMSSSGFM